MNQPTTKNKRNHKKTKAKTIKRNDWKGIFENKVYSNGPGDNIYVYG